MIDTIVFKIHDIKLHEGLANFLEQKARNTGKTVKRKQGETDFSVNQKLLHKTFIVYHDTGNLVEIGHFNNLKSSHYSLAYQIDYVRDFILFNLSIPKYCFGTNIVQYMPNPAGARFSYSLMQDIQYCLSNSYEWLMHFFKRFFKSEFSDLPVYKSMCFLERLDLCYNQVFPTKSEALEYLQQVKRVKKKFSRDASNYSRSWETSMMYKTERYSFKVYHKGSEYKANDLKKHKQLNKEAGKRLFDTDYLQQFSDKILRYEMTIRNSFISHVFMHEIFRKDCEVWASCKEIYRQYKNKQSTDKYLEWRRTLEPFQRKELAYAQHHIFKTKKFCLSEKNLSPEFDYFTDRAEIHNFTNRKPNFEPFSFFSKELFNLLAAKFTALLQEFQIELKQDKNTIINKLNFHNKTVKEQLRAIKKFDVQLTTQEKKTMRKISLSKISVALELLAIHNFSEIEKMDVYTRKTWYNIRKDLELLGVTEKSLLDLTVNASFDNRLYISEIIYNQSKFLHLNFIY